MKAEPGFLEPTAVRSSAGEATIRLIKMSRTIASHGSPHLPFLVQLFLSVEQTNQTSVFK